MPLRYILRMIRYISLIIFLIYMGTLFASDQKQLIVIETSLGDIHVALDKRAPRTVENFLTHVRLGHYNQPGTSFYRVVTTKNDTFIGSKKLRPDGKRIGVIQGGVAMLHKDLKESLSLPEQESFVETSEQTGVEHQKGTIAMARSVSGENMSSTEFFINVEGAFSELNSGTSRYENYNQKDHYGMPAFGKVVKGMKVVKKIYRLRKKVPQKSQMLVSEEQGGFDQSVKILKVYEK